MDKVVLVVAAHPDDEVLGCGGTIARHSDAGDIVHILFMSDGVLSRINRNINEIDQRKNAAKKVSLILGAESPRFLNYADNCMDATPFLDIVQSLEQIIKEVGPDVIYTHHLGDLNIDHQLTHKAVMTACRPFPGSLIREIYSFEILSSTDWASSSSRNLFIPNALPLISPILTCAFNGFFLLP